MRALLAVLALGFGWDGGEFDLEDQRSVRADRAPGPALAVSQLRGDEQLPLRSHGHELQRLSPAFDHFVDRKGSRLATLVGTVELRVVQERAAVIANDGIGGCRLRSGAFCDDV